MSALDEFSREDLERWINACHEKFDELKVPTHEGGLLSIYGRLCHYAENSNEAARIAALEAERDELIAALESTDALIEEDMGEWYGVQFAHLPVDYANRAHIRDAVAAVLAKVTK